MRPLPEGAAGKYQLALAVAVPLVLLDYLTKRAVLAWLQTVYASRDVVGDFVRIHLLLNRGAAFSIGVGDHGRWIMLGLSLAVLAYVVWLLVRAAPAERMRVAALAAIIAGAVGNALDRLISDRGVVDFIDVGIGQTRFWVFNVADASITIGVALLLLTYHWHHQAHPRHREA